MQRLISENWCLATADLADMLIGAGYVAASKHVELVDLLAQHADCYSEGEHDGRCKCGKWIEYGQYDMSDHLSSVLKDAGLLLTDGSDS